MSSVWDNFDHFKKFEIFFKYNEKDQAYLKKEWSECTQATVIITANPVDKNGVSLNITSADLKKVTHLCHYADDSYLWLDSPGYAGNLYEQSSIQNYKSVLVENAGAENSTDGKAAGDVDCEAYIARNSNDMGTFKFACRIDVPGHGTYCTGEQHASDYPESIIEAIGITDISEIITSFNTLNISHSNYAGAQSTIYANGRNQTPVTVSISALDAKQHLVNITVDDIFPTSIDKQYSPARLEIINNSNNDDVLGFNGTSGYCYTRQKNEWCLPLGYNSTSNSTLNQENGNLDLQLYIYSYTQMTNVDLAVRVCLSEDVKYTTAKNSTGNWKGFTHSFISVQMAKPVNYSAIENLAIIGEDEWQLLSDNCKWSVYTNKWFDDYSGSARSKHVTIKPKDTNLNFVDKHITLAGVKHIFQPRDEFKFYKIPNEKSELALDSYTAAVTGNEITYIQSLYNLDTQPEGDILIWGVQPVMKNNDDRWGLHCLKESHTQHDQYNSKYIQYYGRESEDYIGYIIKPKLLPDVINLHCIHLNIDAGGKLVARDWKDQINPVSVDVIDDHGNSGTFTITWSNDSTQCVLDN